MRRIPHLCAKICSSSFSIIEVDNSLQRSSSSGKKFKKHLFWIKLAQNNFTFSYFRYLDNGFGELLPATTSSSSSSSREMPSIILNFDPVGEPFEEKGVYYVKSKGISCVVCGIDDCFCLRKDIVPKVTHGCQNVCLPAINRSWH